MQRNLILSHANTIQGIADGVNSLRPCVWFRAAVVRIFVLPSVPINRYIIIIYIITDILLLYDIL